MAPGKSRRVGGDKDGSGSKKVAAKSPSRKSSTSSVASAGAAAGAADGGAAAGAPTQPIVAEYKAPRASHIPNKIKRSEVYARERKEKQKARDEAKKKRKRAAEVYGEAVPKMEPRTLENTREEDDTVVKANDDEVLGDEAEDEFADYFAGTKTPKIMITTQHYATAPTFRFIHDLLSLLPNAFYYKRGTYHLKQITKWASNKGFTHLLVLNEKAKKLNALYVCHLPVGPTAMFKLSSQQLGMDIENHGRATTHTPEIILNRFETRLGHRVGRMLGSMFPHNPEFTGRRVVTFHNQRDFIFIRHHRYMFTDNGESARLQELGPRFTLKLKWMLAGTFDTIEGEYEWVHKRHDMDTSRRRFHL